MSKVKRVFGTGRFTKNGRGFNTAQEVPQVLGILKENGIDELDTARIYGEGTSEELLGEAAEFETFIVSTKAHPLVHLEQKQDNIDSAFSGSSQQQYNDECDNCSSEMEQKPNRNENEVDNSFNVDILTQLHSNDKEYQELLAINLADQHLWKKRIFY
ncbi:unnamed protein product [Rotaria sordida]|uniref:NADP-dependent oxidoreductase domain-containing protein n=1 Tax=Rotaria sordida TaxID=392033 RepID=A0A814S0J5_9BILA|nr:unnamed protein product [Rotaria sordida]